MKASVVRNRARHAILALQLTVAALLAASLPACDSSSFTPERPPELAGPADASARRAPAPAAPTAASSTAATAPAAPGGPARARLIELLLSEPPKAERQYLAQFLRRDTGLNRCAFRMTVPENLRPFTAAELAEAIRAATNRSTGALLVEPIDAPEVRQALLDAQSRGLPVVLLDRTLEGASPGKSFPYVVLKGFEEGARKLVTSLVDDAKAMGHAPDSPAVYFASRNRDVYQKQKQEAMTAALKEAKRTFDVVPFEGDQKVVSGLLAQHLKDHPKLSIVLGDDEYAVAGSFELLEPWKKKDRKALAAGGLAVASQCLDAKVVHYTQGLVDRNVEGYARKLLQLALDLMGRKNVPERNEIELSFVHRSPEPEEETEEVEPKVISGSDIRQGISVKPAPVEAKPAAPRVDAPR
ncbi:MAG: hypothetical protein U0790_25555 [Isosphaeraceae bacterium]